MNKKALGEMALTAYNSIDKIALLIEDTINKKSLLAASAEFAGNILAAFENISSLLHRKTLLINTRIMFDNALLRLETMQTKILYLKYVDRFSNSQICSALDLCERTYYRKLNTAVLHFGNNVFSEGLDDMKCRRLFENESWLEKIYNYFCEKDSAIDLPQPISFKGEIKKLKCV